MPPARLLFLSLLAPAACALAACTAAVAPPETMATLAPEVTRLPLGSTAPAGPPGACWGRQETPAVIETVTEQIEDRPAQYDGAGQLVRPARYRTETRQRIVEERAVLWFRTPCAAELSPDVVASLQRALAARGFYQGAPTGAIDAATTAAIRRYQAPRGLNSGTLALAAAEDLGVIAVGHGS